MSKNFSIYIHFPFCEKKCNYCNFYSLANRTELIPRWAEAVVRELELYRAEFRNKKLKSIYIGGGSPNLIPKDSFQKIIGAVKNFTDLSHLEEFTVEINPHNFSDQLLQTMRDNGVDRISLGGQSFFQSELEVLGRLHTPQQIQLAIDRIRSFNFPRISLDFIFGIPGQDLNTWETTLEQAVKTGVEHLSLYNLSYEPGTPLTQYLKKGKVEKLDEDLEWQMYKLAHNYLKIKALNIMKFPAGQNPKLAQSIIRFIGKGQIILGWDRLLIPIIAGQGDGIQQICNPILIIFCKTKNQLLRRKILTNLNIVWKDCSYHCEEKRG